MAEVTGEKVKVDDWEIYYEKHGTGPHIVLCMPGALGCCDIDFVCQFKAFDLTKFTLIGWDPPGYGKSRPPQRYYINYYRRDAKYAARLMEVLGYQKYSLMGFSDGGRTALIVAANNPDKVHKLVAWGCNAFVGPVERKFSKMLRDISLWDEVMLGRFKAVYGNDFKTLWEKWTDAYTLLDDVCRNDLAKITASTFLFHGMKDALPYDQTTYIVARIKKAKVHTFPTGQHWLHETHAEEFNKLVQEFLDDDAFKIYCGIPAFDKFDTAQYDFHDYEKIEEFRKQL